MTGIGQRHRDREDNLLDELRRTRALLWAAQCVLLDTFALMDDIADVDPTIRPNFGDRWHILHADVRHFLESCPWMPQPSEMPACYPDSNPVSNAEPCS